MGDAWEAATFRRAPALHDLETPAASRSSPRRHRQRRRGGWPATWARDGAWRPFDSAASGFAASWLVNSPDAQTSPRLGLGIGDSLRMAATALHYDHRVPPTATTGTSLPRSTVVGTGTSRGLRLRCLASHRAATRRRRRRRRSRPHGDTGRRVAGRRHVRRYRRTAWS